MHFLKKYNVSLMIIKAKCKKTNNLTPIVALNKINDPP